MDWAKATARRDEKQSSFEFGAAYIRGLTVLMSLCRILAMTTDTHPRAYGFVLLCVVLVLLWYGKDVYESFTHILQVCFTEIGPTILRLPCYQWSEAEGYIDHSKIDTVLCRYIAVNFLTNINERHPIAHQLGRGLGCQLWIQHFVDILPQFL